MPSPPHENVQPAAAILAYIFPGLGYLYLAQPARAAHLALGVLGLTIAGSLIGGIDVVDRHADFWWFIPQAGIGPLAFAIDWLRHNPLAATLTPSVGRVNEVGTLFVVMAGMINAIAIIDCAWHAPPPLTKRAAAR